mmetsp:Transcript_19640/g.27400  ORF Transcript_19640/g.27400 Transcript_19640/m.27400 type:complete len:225 (-) Transcript_19640:35-709(-)
MAILSKLLHHKDIKLTVNLWLPYLDQIVAGIILQNMAWSAGRVAATIRGSAVACLHSLMQMAEAAYSEDSTLGTAIIKCITQLQFVDTFLACLDDDYDVETRKAMCRNIASLFRLGKSQLTADQTKPLYEALLKRLDDNEDLVRIEATMPLKEYLKLVEASPEEHKEDYQAILKVLAVHFDDLNTAVKQAVGSTLLQASAIQALWSQYSKNFTGLHNADLGKFK